ncbi:MAG: hypothetical protein WBG57_03105 [Ornithinimicrobium sp.]
MPTFADRVLPFDLSTARILATYRGPEHAPFDDALIAAVADSAEMTIATRNTKHFEPLGVLASIHGTRPHPHAEPSPERWASTAATSGTM